ncbi:ABC transporter ATP-binding protein [Yersinia pseudotuberculosis]|uniref:ABC transporter ATP-binding protein n=1 Tax=Yersinia pseudotuberculosis TaxID=633 RepID=UPI00065CE16B|nr:ABC transporter ATP-binding protein [Yersinia pseudotuberculosis]BET63141.1 ABC transporter ATP-binding protein [Yersinia pseudotuberculosis]CRY70864.1 putative iron-siderophore transport system %2CATP-binding component [Yersinia pseudotuberculosis]
MTPLENPGDISDKPRLTTQKLSLGYGQQLIINKLSLSIKNGAFSVIIGPNGCGKSTLLRALSRSLLPQNGSIRLDQQDIQHYKAKVFARQLSLLSQGASISETLTVFDLVSRGRYAHQSFFHQWSTEDERIVKAAISAVNLESLVQQRVSELSGGQRQRAWFAMTLAQHTPIVLLDEPTTYLDIAHQIEMLDLCQELQQQGKTLVLVLHDINQALRYATHLIMLKEGQIYAEGLPESIVTEDSITAVFGLRCRIITDPESGKPLVIPRRQSR